MVETKNRSLGGVSNRKYFHLDRTIGNGLPHTAFSTGKRCHLQHCIALGACCDCLVDFVPWTGCSSAANAEHCSSELATCRISLVLQPIIYLVDRNQSTCSWYNLSLQSYDGSNSLYWDSSSDDLNSFSRYFNVGLQTTELYQQHHLCSSVTATGNSYELETITQLMNKL